MKAIWKVLMLAGVGLTSAQAFACPGVIASLLNNCQLDDLSRQLQESVPPTRAILNPRDAIAVPMPSPVPSPVPFPAPLPALVVGWVCLTPTGVHPLGVAMSLGSSCSGINQFGVFEVGVVAR